jgi:hypothetical protein
MEQIWEFMDGSPMTGGIFTPESVLLSLLLRFVLARCLHGSIILHTAACRIRELCPVAGADFRHCSDYYVRHQQQYCNRVGLMAQWPLSGFVMF